MKKEYPLTSTSVLLFSFLFLSGCDEDKLYPDITKEQALNTIKCKNCSTFKVKISKSIQNCLSNKETEFPIYLRTQYNNSLLMYGFLNLPLSKNNYTGSVQSRFTNSQSLYDDDFLWGKWDNMNEYGKAEINYNKYASFIQLSVPNEFIKNNRYSDIEQDVNGLLDNYCYQVEEYITINKDVNSWEQIK